MDELAVRRAQKLLQSGLDRVEDGELETARQQFIASAQNHPTADALTYWGWMEFHCGNTDRAIELCEKAILLDPDFGNPYNDIGSYLIERGELDEAIPWLNKALEAKRYEPRHYPHINLGRIALAKGDAETALCHYQAALDLDPGNPELIDQIDKILKALH